MNFWFIGAQLQKLEHGYAQVLGMPFDASLAQHQICIMTFAL